MKHLKIAGLCLVSMFVVSMAFSATASAGVWEHCTKGNDSGVSKFFDHNCSSLGVIEPNEWEWKEVKNTEEVRLKGSLRLKDTGTLVGTAEVECSGEAVGTVGHERLARINEIRTSAAQCRQIAVCENIEFAEATHLPWQTEVYQTEGKKLEKLIGTTNGEPGWKVECKAPIVGLITDECEQEPGKSESILLQNKSTEVKSVDELLVLATFQHLRKIDCSVGGKEKGEITGSLAILQANGWGLRVS
jgi:hypothetical protein